MSIYIKNIEMPKKPDEMIEVAIFGDGKVVQTGESWRSPEDGKCYYTTTNPEKIFGAVEVLPHGRLIDADKLHVHDYWHNAPNGEKVHFNFVPLSEVKYAPTVIEKEEEICIEKS